MTGLGKEAALLQSVGIGVTNLIFTFVGLWLIDRLGRRTLLYIGSFGYILSLGLWPLRSSIGPQFKVASTAISLVEITAKVEKVQETEAPERVKVEEDFAKTKADLMRASADAATGPARWSSPRTPRLARRKRRREKALAAASQAAGSGGLMVMVCIFAFIAAHAVGQGTVIWVLISEIFPNRHRGRPGAGLFYALGLCRAAGHVLSVDARCARAGPYLPLLLRHDGLATRLVVLMVPETKGVSLEEIQHKLGIE